MPYFFSLLCKFGKIFLLFEILINQLAKLETVYIRLSIINSLSLPQVLAKCYFLLLKQFVQIELRQL
ncbi:hypothetical protein FGO68_gene4660 [Halteria grandinella]|uniref:Uncharacterized protein n=1 Tax=Halteria grandinella TaxID=5974 RepID=A0A8J8P2S6_HALGN|nr:hypothetical protein FGO68_gene4660 [Halteria grandinella]